MDARPVDGGVTFYAKWQQNTITMCNRLPLKCCDYAAA